MLPKGKAPLHVATDGVATLYRPTPARLAPGLDWRTDEGLEPVCTVPVKALRVRAGDVEQSAADGQSLDLKLSALVPSCATTEMVCGREGALFDVVRLDREGRVTYLYLQQQQSDGTVTLMGQKTSYDDLGQAVRETWGTEVVAASCRLDADAGVLRLTVRIRSADYRGEPTVERDGAAYHVDVAVSAGEWTELQCLTTAHDGEGGIR